MLTRTVQKVISGYRLYLHHLFLEFLSISGSGFELVAIGVDCVYRVIEHLRDSCGIGAW